MPLRMYMLALLSRVSAYVFYVSLLHTAIYVCCFLIDFMSDDLSGVESGAAEFPAAVFLSVSRSSYFY